MVKFKWYLSIGINVETYREKYLELNQFDLLPKAEEDPETKSPELKKQKTKKKVAKITNPYKAENIFEMSAAERFDKYQSDVQIEINQERKFKPKSNDHKNTDMRG